MPLLDRGVELGWSWGGGNGGEREREPENKRTPLQNWSAGGVDSLEFRNFLCSISSPVSSLLSTYACVNFELLSSCLKRAIMLFGGYGVNISRYQQHY